MHLAEESAKRSKDPRTKVGSCIVKDKRVLSLGYNGAPRNFPDSFVPENNTSTILEDRKNTYMCHSELNAILNYRGNLSDLDGATIYVTLSPCHECMKAIIQSGIKEVIYKERFDKEDIFNMSYFIANVCGVKYRKIED